MDWSNALPRPVAFVLSGGASLGAIQVGMLQALSSHGIEPDLVVGTSVGALNGAVVADEGATTAAAERLVGIWSSLSRADVFPQRLTAQALRVARGRSLYSNLGLRMLIRSTSRVEGFDELALPLAVVTTDVLTGHVTVLTAGDLLPALLASAAIPGLLPPVDVDGRALQDGGIVANVPVTQALVLGAGAIVVLDAADVCHLDVPPRLLPDGLVASLNTAVRQRVLLEAPLVAERVPVLYLPRPCVRNRSPLDLDHAGDLIDPAREFADRFLDATVELPVRGMVGAPHMHGDAPYRPHLIATARPVAAPRTLT